MDPQLAQEMGVFPARFQHIQQAPTFAEAERRLTALKVEAKANYRKLAFKYHPDRNPGNAEAEAKFKALGGILQAVEKLRIQPPVQAIFVRIPSPSSTTTGAPFRSTTTGYDARRVVFIRAV